MKDSAKKRRTEEILGRNILNPTQDLREAVNAMKREPLQIMPKQNQNAMPELAAFIRKGGRESGRLVLVEKNEEAVDENPKATIVHAVYLILNK